MDGLGWGYKKNNGKHISIFWVDEEGLFQIGYHNIQGDVVLTELEISLGRQRLGCKKR